VVQKKPTAQGKAKGKATQSEKTPKAKGKATKNIQKRPAMKIQKTPVDADRDSPQIPTSKPIRKFKPIQRKMASEPSLGSTSPESRVSECPGVDWSQWRIVNIEWDMTRMIVPTPAHVWTVWRGKQYLNKLGFKPSQWEDHGNIHVEEPTADPKPAGPEWIQIESIQTKPEAERTMASQPSLGSTSQVDKWGIDWSQWRHVNLIWDMKTMIVPATAHVWTFWRGKQYLSKPGFKRSEWENHGYIHEEPAGNAVDLFSLPRN
jgi:hypothetical protein